MSLGPVAPASTRGVDARREATGLLKNNNKEKKIMSKPAKKPSSLKVKIKEVR